VPSFILRKIDTALWQAFRDKAFASGSTPKAVLLQFIADYVKGNS
jgi:hypothetical protein